VTQNNEIGAKILKWHSKNTEITSNRLEALTYCDVEKHNSEVYLRSHINSLLEI